MATLNQAYHYKTGDRPLDGYTVQRGVGRGAFGEVYYALSDSGREVALKSVLGYEQIELRGVTQCMNLKSPYLVNIFDIRQNDEGRNFVIMEYVAGPSLRDLLNDSPSGLGTQKAAFFLREIGKGLTYLHDRGIVHRDLKPGNIFYEDGYVKIGDYGLSKAITPSQHSGQTITVGTVHYMAPEIGQGRYDKNIDIYAMGVLLFEMLTGHVPFFGASHGEILMKHLMETPDVTGIEEPFATVIKKAMAKDPNERYQTVQEMVEAVFGAEHIQQSVSVFRPESLSVVAERVARNLVTAGGPGSSADLTNTLRVDRPVNAAGAEDSSDVWLEFGRRMEQASDRFRQAGERFAEKQKVLHQRLAGSRERLATRSAGKDDFAPDVTADPMTRRQRRLLALATTGVIALGTGFLGAGRVNPGIVVLLAAMAILGGSIALVWANRRLIPGRAYESDRSHRFVIGIPGIVGTILLSFPFLAPMSDSYDDEKFVATYFAMAASFLLIRWDKVMSRNRRERVMLGQAIGAGVTAFIVASFFGGLEVVAMGIMAGIGLVAQIASPFVAGAHVNAPAANRSAGTQPARNAPDAERHAGVTVPPPLPRRSQRTNRDTNPHALAGQYGQHHNAGPAGAYPTANVPMLLRIMWFALFVLSLGGGLFSLLALSAASHNDEPAFLAAALGCGICVINSLIQVRRRVYFGWWGSIVRPLVMMLCLGTVAISLVILPDARGDEAMIAAFFAGFPGALFFGLLFIPKDIFGPPGVSIREQRREPLPDWAVSDSQWFPTMVLTWVGFLGIGGLQRLYVGKIGTGLIWMFTFGLFGVGQVYDLIMLACGEFTDAQGRKVREKGDSIPPPTMMQPVANAAAPLAGTPAATKEAKGDPSSTEPQSVPEPRTDSPPLPQAIERPLVPRILREPRRTSLLWSVLGYAFLIPAVIIGAAAVFRVPAFAAICIPGFGASMSEALNYSGWPLLLTRVGLAMSAAMLVIAALLLVVARREAGAGHSARAVLGVIGLFITGSIGQQMLERIPWADLVIREQNIERLEMSLNSVNGEDALGMAVALLISGVLLAWPEHRERITVNSTAREGVAA